ncbi:hypothetical protein SIN8267_00656 [Sinobacterium norvegicum]|uniref:Pseudouridine synthase RsuA/RluA-like domain-containing protein n=1 Tax=Sinobacterium norvegicum TaxID=1641715 RepID=A0ABM9ABI6_9GAMM|nr:RluA family pseudouridine synthase [Sinobacterium norvegicum]CAH0990563.1 hypothetical protein SIN8267_00656 [Sinobacterium norvegicum]
MSSSQPPTNTVIEHHCQLEQGCPDAAALLALETGLSKQQIKQAMQKGAVWSGSGKKPQRLRRNKALAAGQQLHLYFNHNVLAQMPGNAQLIDDRGSYSIWYKPCGMYSQGSKWGDHCTIARFAELALQRPGFIVHRLDRATSGLMLVGHSKTTTRNLSELFQQHAIDKQYMAVCEGLLTEPATVTRDIDERSACSHITPLEQCQRPAQSLVKVAIESGRKHQIRRHLLSLGHPIIGDRLHGNANKNSPDLQLFAYRLAFDCPVTGQPLSYQLEPQFLPALPVLAG